MYHLLMILKDDCYEWLVNSYVIYISYEQFIKYGANSSIILLTVYKVVGIGINFFQLGH